MCGEKQSLKRNYGIGSAKECRGHVQKLNNIRGEVNDSKNIDSEDEESDESPPIYKYKIPKSKLKRSKWNDFVDETEAIETQPTGDNSEVVLDLPKKPRKKFQVKYNSAPEWGKVQIKENINIKTESLTKSNVKLELLENEIKQRPLQLNVVKASSKWAQFVDENKQKFNSDKTLEACKSKNSLSIFEDEDIDSILDL